MPMFIGTHSRKIQVSYKMCVFTQLRFRKTLQNYFVSVLFKILLHHIPVILYIRAFFGSNNNHIKVNALTGKLYFFRFCKVFIYKCATRTKFAIKPLFYLNILTPTSEKETNRWQG